MNKKQKSPLNKTIDFTQEEGEPYFKECLIDTEGKTSYSESEIIGKTIFGDSLCVMKKLPPSFAHLVIADPPYNIEKIYPNGVRAGNIPDHKDRRKRVGLNQTWFPASWNERTIKRAAEHIAQLHRNRNASDGQIMYGTYKGVRIGVIKTHGQIATAFPDSKQP